jgi:hypothetical protein
MVPCPHHARHLVVSAATADSTFGTQFENEFVDTQKSDVARQKTIFALARAGYEVLFKLNNDDQAVVDKRLLELGAKTVVGIHVRHGDCHPMDFQYKDSYIPLDRYSEKARDVLHRTFNGRPDGENELAEMHSIMVVASDDPDVYDSMEFSHASRAQEHIYLVSKKAMGEKAEPAPTGNMFKNFVEEAVGWEGGFFAAMFWGLEKSTTASVIETSKRKLQPTMESSKLRELVGRAYLMDLAILGRGADAIVCTVSSMGCKLLAVMMGWEAAMEKEGWLNIDGDFEWRGAYGHYR